MTKYQVRQVAYCDLERGEDRDLEDRDLEDRDLEDREVTMTTHLVYLAFIHAFRKQSANVLRRMRL